MSKQTWTTKQDEIIFIYGHMGVEKVRDILKKEAGIERSIPSIQHRASRIGASLFAYEVCPICGARVKRLTDKGWCQPCKTKERTQRMKEENVLLSKELYENTKNREVTLRYYAEKQRKYRLRNNGKK